MKIFALLQYNTLEPICQQSQHLKLMKIGKCYDVVESMIFFNIWQCGIQHARENCGPYRWHDFRCCMVCRDLSFTFFGLYVCLSVALSMKSMKFGSRYLVDSCQNGTKFGTLIVRALLYVNSKMVNFGLLEYQNSEVGKKNCNTFLPQNAAMLAQSWKS